MANIIKLIALCAIILVIIHLNNNICMLAKIIETQQCELERLRGELVSGYAKSTLALKMSMANKNSIQNIRRKKVVNVTAYSPNESETDATPFQTASNRRVRNGIVAVSRDLFDQGWVFGRKIYIKSLGIFTIDDLMADSKKNQIDIFMFDTQQALLFGKKTMEAHLLALEPVSQTDIREASVNISYAYSAN